VETPKAKKDGEVLIMKPMSIQLRTPNPEEFLKVAEFSFNNFVNETAKATGEHPSALKEKLGGPPTEIWDDDVWYLIENNGTQLGFVWVQLKPEEKTAFGYDIYLEPQFRSQGIGRKVMIECGKRLNALGIESVEICVFEHNEIARKLYASLGFTEKKYDEKRKQFTLSVDIRGIEN
jgi:ribosomal protein S18 acetylase RimI-like enzyme